MLIDNYYIDNYNEPHSLEIFPGDEVRIPITAGMFEWEDDRTTLPNEATLLRDLKRARVNVKTTVRAGSKALDYVQLNTDVFDGEPFYNPGSTDRTGRTAYISIMFAEKLVSTEPVDFDYSLRLSANGDRSEEFVINLVGTFHNDIFDVTEGLDYLEIYDGTVAHGLEYNPKVNLDLGNGVSINKIVLKDRKYYGFSTVVEDMSIIRETYPDIFPSVVAVYKLETVNMQYNHYGIKIVPRLDRDIPEMTYYHVYNEDFLYLGTTNDRLHFSDVYILSTEKIDNMEEDLYDGSLIDAPTQEKA